MKFDLQKLNDIISQNTIGVELFKCYMCHKGIKLCIYLLPHYYFVKSILYYFLITRKITQILLFRNWEK